ncbi:Myosin type II regulatory light chain [Chamberlinius hualienensis]
MADDKKERKKKTKKKEEEEAAPAPEPAPDTKSSTKSSTKRAAKRTGSSVFSMFSQRQVQEFKEAFQLMDANKDGIIDKRDLRATFDVLGRLANDNDLDEMLSEAPGPLNFTMFLSIFGDRITGTDDEDVIMNAFAQYDDGGGLCSSDKLKHDLMTWGEKFKAGEVADAFEQAPIDDKGFINLKGFANVLTKGVEDEEEGAA